MITQETRIAIYDALRRLGTDRNAVAQMLRARNIKGRRNAARSCPVANYLKGEFPDLDRIVVNTGTVIINSEARVSVPTPVHRFIMAFDSFSFSDLRE